MSIDGTVSIGFTANDRRTVGLNAAANIPVNQQPSLAFTNGAGALQAAILYQASRPLIAGADSVALYGTLKDSYGSTVNSAKIKAIFIQNNSATNPMTFGADSVHPWVGLLNSTGTITLQPGDSFLAMSGSAGGYIVATTDVIKVVGTGTDAYSIAFLAA